MAIKTFKICCIGSSNQVFVFEKAIAIVFEKDYKYLARVHDF